MRHSTFARLASRAQQQGRTLVDVVISADATAFEVHDLDAGDVAISWSGPLSDLPRLMADAGIDEWITTAEIWSAVDWYAQMAGFADADGEPLTDNIAGYLAEVAEFERERASRAGGTA